MNKNVCQLCRRFSNLKGNKREDLWYCATTLYPEDSAVIPGHSFLVKNDLRPITSSMTKPPTWCERILEQTILNSNEKVELEQDSNIVYNGNNLAEWHVKERQVNQFAIYNGPDSGEPV
jgi:hypothetical protein